MIDSFLCSGPDIWFEKRDFLGDDRTFRRGDKATLDCRGVRSVLGEILVGGIMLPSKSSARTMGWPPAVVKSRSVFFLRASLSKRSHLHSTPHKNNLVERRQAGTTNVITHDRQLDGGDGLRGRPASWRWPAVCRISAALWRLPTVLWGRAASLWWLRTTVWGISAATAALWWTIWWLSATLWRSRTR